MANYTATVRTDWSPEIAFDYLARFDNITEWDPGVAGASLLSGEPGEVGSRYEVEVSFMGRVTPMTYETLEAEAPHILVLRSELPTMISLDRLTFDPAPGGGTAVTYEAELKMKGIAKLADPLMQLAFLRLGDKARDGLAERLSGPEPAATTSGSPA